MSPLNDNCIKNIHTNHTTLHVNTQKYKNSKKKYKVSWHKLSHVLNAVSINTPPAPPTNHRPYYSLGLCLMVNNGHFRATSFYGSAEGVFGFVYCTNHSNGSLAKAINSHSLNPGSTPTSTMIYRWHQDVNMVTTDSVWHLTPARLRYCMA